MHLHLSGNVEKCSFSLGTRAQGHAWHLAEYESNRRTDQPARHPKERAASASCCGHTSHPHSFRESPRDGAKSYEKKYSAKQMRYADGGGMNAQREEFEMRTKTKKEGRDFHQLMPLTDEEPT